MDAIKCEMWIDDGAFFPTKSHENDAGLDLKAIEGFYTCHDSVVIDTGVHIVIPEGYVGLLFGRSGNHINRSWDTQGVIDAGFTGSIKIRIHSDDGNPIDIDRGDRIAQLVILPIPKVDLVLKTTLSKEARGNDGYGSTGR